MDEEECLKELSADILRNCLDNNVGGIEVDVLLFNEQDIDRTATVFSVVNDVIITTFQLKPGCTGYLLKGVKQVNALKFELVPKELSDDAWKHTFTGIIPNASAENKQRLQELKAGFVCAMVQTKFKGVDNKDAFHLGGYFSGLKLTTATYASNEADGTIAFELSSPEGYEEPKPIATVLLTTYAATATAFGNKFAQPATP